MATAAVTTVFCEYRNDLVRKIDGQVLQDVRDRHVDRRIRGGIATGHRLHVNRGITFGDRSDMSRGVHANDSVRRRRVSRRASQITFLATVVVASDDQLLTGIPSRDEELTVNGSSRLNRDCQELSGIT